MPRSRLMASPSSMSDTASSRRTLCWQDSIYRRLSSHCMAEHVHPISSNASPRATNRIGFNTHSAVDSFAVEGTVAVSPRALAVPNTGGVGAGPIVGMHVVVGAVDVGAILGMHSPWERLACAPP